MELFLTVACRWKDHCHFYWSLTIVAIVTKTFNLDETVFLDVPPSTVLLRNQYFTSFFASFFKPKLVLLPEKKIWEPKQDGVKMLFLQVLELRWDYIKIANDRYRKQTLSSCKRTNTDVMVCYVVSRKLLLFLVIYISVVVSAFKIKSHIFSCFSKT